MARAAARADVPTLMELVGRVDSPLLRLARDFDAAFETRLQFLPLSQLWLLLQVGQLSEEESFAAVYLLNQRYSQHAVKVRPFTPHLLAMASCSATPAPLRQFIAEVLRGEGQVMEASPNQLRAEREAAALVQHEPMASGLELETLLQEFGEGREEVERIFGCLPAAAVPSTALQTAARSSKQQEAVEAWMRAMRARRPHRDAPCRAGGSSSSSAAAQPAAGPSRGDGNGKPALPEEACLQLRARGGDGPAAGPQGLLEEAQAKPLTPAALQQLLQAVRSDPGMLRQLRLQPAAIPALVRHNADVAREVLGTVMGGPEESDWLQVLASMDMSLNSMEVVNELCASRQLPPEFVESYISNCVGRCHAVHDRYMQSRLVRLLCMFLQILIRDRLITIQGAVRHQVEALCVQFGHIKEAAGLFRHLKSLSLQGGADSAPAEGPRTDGDVPPALASTSSHAAGDTAASAAPQQPAPAAGHVEAA